MSTQAPTLFDQQKMNQQQLVTAEDFSRLKILGLTLLVGLNKQCEYITLGQFWQGSFHYFHFDLKMN